MVFLFCAHTPKTRMNRAFFQNFIFEVKNEFQFEPNIKNHNESRLLFELMEGSRALPSKPPLCDITSDCILDYIPFYILSRISGLYQGSGWSPCVVRLYKVLPKKDLRSYSSLFTNLHIPNISYIFESSWFSTVVA